MSDGLSRLGRFLDKLRWDVYPEPRSDLHESLTRQMFTMVCETCGLGAGARVLDVGCGEGGALELFRAAGMRATGIALGEDVDACRQRGLDVLEMDLAFLDFPDATFDLVWCRHALEHSIFPYFVLSEMHRVLKPGGVLYVEVPSPDTACQHEANPNHYSVFGKRMWQELIRRSGFVDMQSYDINVEVALGPDLYWALVQRRPA
jgi:SAM-dependent methyltransferase